MRRSTRTINVGAIRLHTVEAGDVRGPLVILLHGFPGYGGSWHAQIDALASSGFRVLAPDQRGFHLSDKPRSVRAYRLDELASDVAALIRVCSARRAIVVGHDWGGQVAWMFAQRFPRMVEKLVIINVPHPRRSLEEGLRSIEQLRKSWYFFFFQLPRLPELWLSRNDYRNLRGWLTREGVRSSEIVGYVAAAKAGGDSLRGGVNYYRAFMRQVVARTFPRWNRIDAPTLVIWGEKDSFISKGLADPGPELVERLRIERFADARHFVHHDAPGQVNDLLLDFVRDSLDLSCRPA
jgi:pimeloyl-ACP methyl ester carboxylesterase